MFKRIMATILAIGLLSTNIVFATEVTDGINEKESATTEVTGAEELNDFYTFIDMQNCVGRLSWEKTKLESYNAEYKVEIAINHDWNNPIFSETTTESTVDFTYPEDAIRLSIKFNCNDIFIEKDLDLVNGETVKIFTDNITSNGQVEVAYNVKKPTPLMVVLNGERTFKGVENADSTLISMEAGENTLHVYFDGENLIRYEAYKEIYYDATAPTLTINEDIDGKTVSTSRLGLSGKVVNGNKLTINGKEVELDKNGEFAYLISLSDGENMINVHASNDNGLNTFSLLLVTKENKITSNEIIIYAIGIVLLVTLFVILYLNKKKNKNTKKILYVLMVFVVLLIALCIAGLIYSVCVDIDAKYLELARNSVTSANNLVELPSLTTKGIIIYTIILGTYIIFTQRAHH